jgi:hypothetical protein
MLIKFCSRDNLKQSIEKSLSTSTNEIPPYDPEIIKLKQKLKDLREMPLDGSAIAYNNSIFETIKTTIKYIEVLEYLKKEWPHASYYFSKFPPAELETRTDSTGKFSIDLPKGDWVLVAENHRNVGADTDEYYYWTLPVEGKKSITLSNHNMVTSNSPESLLQTAVSNKPWHP